LSNDHSIKVCNFDGGKGTAILDSDDYYGKLDSILNDKTKFAEVNVNTKTHPLIAKERSIAYYIRKYFKSYDEQIIRKLIPSCSASWKIYGLANIHKENTPLRLVLSMTNAPKYELAKILDSMVKPYLPNAYMLESTSDFLARLNGFKFSTHHKIGKIWRNFTFYQCANKRNDSTNCWDYLFPR